MPRHDPFEENLPPLAPSSMDNPAYSRPRIVQNVTFRGSRTQPPAIESPQTMTDRDERILTAAVRIARDHGYRNLTRQALADATGVAASTVSNYGRTAITAAGARGGSAMTIIRDAVLRRAVETGDLRILAQGLADRHPIALAAPEQLRIAAMASS